MEISNDKDIEIFLSELRRFSTMYNPNDFTEYKDKLKFKKEKVDYVYVSKEPILTKEIDSKHKQKVHCDSSEINLIKQEKDHEDHLFLKNKRYSSPNEKDFNKKIKKNNNNLPNSINKNEKDELQCCPSCEWNFPQKMKLKEKQLHINKCLDGKGKEDIQNYEINLKIKNINDGPIAVDNYQKCPICNKSFNVKNAKIKMNHIANCLRQFQENDYYLHNFKRSKF